MVEQSVGALPCRNASGRVDGWSKQFQEAKPVRHVVMDDFLDESLYSQMLAEFPVFEDRYALNEHGKVGGKATRCDVIDLGASYAEIDRTIASREFLQLVESISGIPDLLYDPDYLGGGTHENRHGQSLAPHVDFNYHPKTGWHRRLNLIVYMNEGWEETWGGVTHFHTDPWNPKQDQTVALLPLANHAVLFETTESSWHSFSQIRLPENQRDRSRKSFAIYLYTQERAPAETAPSHATVYVFGGIPASIEPNQILGEEEFRELNQHVDEQSSYLRLLYDREKQFGAEIVALKARFDDAMANASLPMQGYVSRCGEVVGVWPDLWLEQRVQFSIRAERRVCLLDLDLWVPPDLEGQNLLLSIDGEQVETLHTSADGKLSTQLALDLPEGKETTLTFEFERAWRPPGGDQRNLAAVLRHVTAHHDGSPVVV